MASIRKPLFDQTNDSDQKQSDTKSETSELIEQLEGKVWN